MMGGGRGNTSRAQMLRQRQQLAKMRQTTNTTDDNNDCLYYALKQSDMVLPWRFPGTFKKFLKIDRQDKVYIKCIPKIEEKFSKTIILNFGNNYFRFAQQLFQILEYIFAFHNTYRNSPEYSRKTRIGVQEEKEAGKGPYCNTIGKFRISFKSRF